MASVFVGNLPWSTNEQELGDLFSQCGNVTGVRIVLDRETGRSRGFAFVEYSNPGDADAAISQLNGYDLNGRQIRCDNANRK